MELTPCFRSVSDHAVLVEFGDVISVAANEAVHQLDRNLAAAPFEGFLETVPAYCSLLVTFDPIVTDHATVEAALKALSQNDDSAGVTTVHREVLVCYDEAFALDLPEVSRLTGQSVDDVISCHLSGDYRVYMYGFAPGYAYLAGVPEALQVPRKTGPVSGIEKGSVIIAGPQCLVTTLTMPTGWWVIGRSPTSILTDDADDPFLFGVGDRVSFKRVTRDVYARHGAMR